MAAGSAFLTRRWQPSLANCHEIVSGHGGSGSLQENTCSSHTRNADAGRKAPPGDFAASPTALQSPSLLRSHPRAYPSTKQGGLEVYLQSCATFIRDPLAKTMRLLRKVGTCARGALVEATSPALPNVIARDIQGVLGAPRLQAIGSSFTNGRMPQGLSPGHGTYTDIMAWPADSTLPCKVWEHAPCKQRKSTFEP
jgi:hypothetical protein